MLHECIEGFYSPDHNERANSYPHNKASSYGVSLLQLQYLQMGCNQSTSRGVVDSADSAPQPRDGKGQQEDAGTMSADDAQTDSGQKFQAVLMKNLMAIEGG